MMTGYSGTGKSGKVHHYYICNGVKRKSGCHKKTVQKQYIEDLAIAACRKMLTDENIASIVKGLTSVIEAQPKNMELETFRKELRDIEKKRTNLLNAVAECEIDVFRKSLYEQLAAVETRRSELEFNISVEQSKDVKFTPEMIEFFLLSLRNGDDDDPLYRKALISVFINKIYLYDDKITIHVTTGGDSVEITEQIISNVEASNAEAEGSFKGAFRSTKRANTNSIPLSMYCGMFSYWSLTYNQQRHHVLLRGASATFAGLAGMLFWQS